MFLEQQISILEWVLKDHVTLKTGVMINFSITEINYILENVKTENSYFQFQKQLFLLYFSSNKCILCEHENPVRD